MLRHECRSKVLAKLTPLNLFIPGARYDPAVVPEPVRNRLSGIIDNLKSVLRQIEGLQ